MADLVDKTLGEFRMLRVLGSGGMADVYLAEQTTLQRKVAVKVLKPELMKASGETMLARFKQEAMMAAGLNHANIVQVYTIGDEEGYHYIAQELVQGKDLASILKSKGVPDLGSCLHVIRQVTSALKASGQAGIVHRDIKPENILVNKKGEVKVADFGLAQLHDNPDGGHITREGMTLGTPHYMSPEQVSGKELDPRSDVYSFGVTCYQLLCGKTPFKGASPMAIAVQHLNNLPPQLKEQNPKLPDVICRMVHRMMAKRRSLRYQSAADVYADLKVLVSGYKQGRDLDLVKLPTLEKLDAVAEKARQAKPAATARVAKPAKQQKAAKSVPVAKKKPKPQSTSAAKPAAPEFELADDGPSPFELDDNAVVQRTVEVDSVSYDDAVGFESEPAAAPAQVAVKEVAKETRPVASVADATVNSIVSVALPSWLEEEEEDSLLGRPKPDFEEMDLTPMVDVTFLLLIFFMITASFNLQKKIDLPPAKTEEGAAMTAVEPENLTSVEAQIDSNNVIFIQDEKADGFEDVLRRLTQAKSGSDSVELKLQIDPESTHEKRIIVADAATQAGFSKINSLIKEVD